MAQVHYYLTLVQVHNISWVPDHEIEQPAALEHPSSTPNMVLPARPQDVSFNYILPM